MVDFGTGLPTVSTPTTGANTTGGSTTVPLGSITLYGIKYPLTYNAGVKGFWQRQGPYGGTDVFVPLATVRKTGGGGGGGGGGGLDYSSPNVGSDVRDIYINWYGIDWANSHGSIIANAVNNRWTERQILTDIANRGANDTPYARAMVEYIRATTGPLPLATVMNIIGSGQWLESNWATQIAPQYSTDVMTSYQTLPFMQMWNEYTAGATFGPTAQAKLKDLTLRFGYTPAAEAQWEAWLRTTNSANGGNYGAEKRDVLNQVIGAWFQRVPTADELATNGPYWSMIDGPLGQVATPAFLEALRATPEYQTRFAAKLPGQSEQTYLAWESGITGVGNWYFNDQPGVGGVPYVNNFTGYTPEELLRLNQDGWDANSLGTYYRAVEEAAYLEGVYSPIVQEAFGSNAGIDWFVMANGGQGSGALRAKLMEAQNRVAFREAYRQVFGSDPGPADYDRITNEFVSPTELIREYQALESADEMYNDVNDLLQRVMGQSVTIDELKDMVLGRQNSGELRALINEATKLDAYRWVHKQYFDTEPTPDDYAKYAGYSGVSELQWEIVTTERIAELGPQIQEAWRRAYGYELGQDELQTMLGEQEGYGALREQWTKAQEEVKKYEMSVQAAHEEPKIGIAYDKAALGGFETTLKPFAEL